MPSISSILSSLAGTLGISRNTREGNTPGDNASKRSEAVTDVVRLSVRALQAAKQATAEATRQPAARQDPATEKRDTSAQSEPDLRLIQTLQQNDRAVRAHEQAHIAAGSGIVRSGANFSYQRGPDGKQYAIGGEVAIDTSPGRTPAESITKAQTIRAAALAPADPSPQDRTVAAQAARLEAEARKAFAQQETSAPTAPLSGKTDNAKAHYGLALYQETSKLFDQMKPPPSIRISV